METINDLRAKRAELDAAIWKQEAKERDRKNAKLVGRCFKYRNCYSCPEKESDYWWLYRKITRVEDGSLRAFEFQIDSRGEFEVRPDKFVGLGDNGSGWTEIRGDEFSAAWEDFMTNIGAAALNAGL